MPKTFPGHYYIDIAEDDRSEDGRDTETLKYFWAGLCLLLLISSYVGDTTILIASIKYKAFKLHNVIVVIIQHIAICDLILSSLTTVPRFVSLVAGKWVLGSFPCQWITYAEYYFNPASMFLICSMTTSKLLLLKYPLRFGTASVRSAHSFCGLAWIAVLVLPATLLFVDANDMHFSYDLYRCYYGFTLHIWQYLRPFLAFSFLFAPTCLVVATSLNLLVIAKRIARRGRESLKWQGILTTLLTAALVEVPSNHHGKTAALWKRRCTLGHPLPRPREIVCQSNFALRRAPQQQQQQQLQQFSACPSYHILYFK